VDRQAAETMARRQANTRDRVAGKERELARSARARAQLAQDQGERANLENLARVHDDAAALQTEAATYYRALADRIAAGLVVPSSADLS
jgi:phage terminase Nu1 subunit (DNA packaging protein)